MNFILFVLSSLKRRSTHLKMYIQECQLLFHVEHLLPEQDRTDLIGGGPQNEGKVRRGGPP
jgi:hypothetical protein